MEKANGKKNCLTEESQKKFEVVCLKANKNLQIHKGGQDHLCSGQDRPLIKFFNFNEVAYLSGMPHFPELGVQVDKMTILKLLLLMICSVPM